MKQFLESNMNYLDMFREGNI